MFRKQKQRHKQENKKLANINQEFGASSEQNFNLPLGSIYYGSD
jgi:hypothetical protein